MSGFPKSGGSNSSVTTPGPSYNVVPGNFPNFRKAIANVRSGAGIGTLFVVGDSTSAGAQASSFAENYPSILTGLINSQLVPCAQTWTFPSITFSEPDARLVLGGQWVANASLNGICLCQWSGGNDTVASTMSYTPCGSANGPTSVDTVDIYYQVQNPTFGGTFTVDIGGSTLATQDTTTNGGGTAGLIRKLTVALGSAGTPTINFHTDGSAARPIIIYGMNAYLSTAKILQLGNYACSTTATANWLANYGQVGNGNSGNWMLNYSPDLTIMDFGINDASPLPPFTIQPTATYIANMQTLARRVTAAGHDIMLKSFAPSGPANTGQQAAEALYVPALLAMAAADDYPIVDGYDRFGSYAIANAMGFMGDNLHPNSLGYADIAAAVLETLRVII